MDSEPQAEIVAAPVAEAWRRVLLARHPKRPHALDYIERVFTDFSELHGDRHFGDAIRPTVEGSRRRLAVVIEAQVRESRHQRAVGVTRRPPGPA